VQTEQEVLLVVKTLHERVCDVERIVKDEHPFECPELIALDITAGLPDYLKWVTASSMPPEPQPADAPPSTQTSSAAARTLGGASSAGRGFGN
jgi:periplasmic divalent cation tolerance protein